MLFLFSEVGGRPVAIYLLARCVVNVLSIHADVADDADDVDDADDADDVGDADLAKTLLPTLLFLWSLCFPDMTRSFLIVRKAAPEHALLVSFSTRFDTVFLVVGM
jgi:hypothetical protein